MANDTDTAIAAPAAGLDNATVDALIKQYLNPGSGGLSGPPPPDTPAVNKNLSITGLLGEALGGGVSPLYPMSQDQQEQAGRAALLNFGIGMLQNSAGPVRRTTGQALAAGLEGAQGTLAGVRQGQAQAMTLQQKQQEMQLERLKSALPLLQMQRAGSMPNLLAPGSTAAAGGGAGGAAPGTAPPQLTPFVAKNLPEGVTPAEDQIVRTVIGEAGNQPLEGQQGVAAVIKNRMELGKQDAQSTIFAPNQFEPWNNATTRAKLEALDPTSQQYQDVLNKVVRPVMGGTAKDPTGGATNFYSPTAQKALGRDVPAWSVGQTPSTTIGGHQFYKLPFGPGTQVAGPGAGPTGAPAAPGSAPPSASTAPPAPASTAPAVPAPDVPNAKLSWEQFRARNGGLLTADEKAAATVTPDPADLQQAQASMQTEAQNLQLARSAGNIDAANKAQDNFESARNHVANLKQTAAQNTIANIRAAQEAKDKPLIDLYKQAQEQAATATENDKQRAAALQIENVKAGNNYHQQLDKESAEFANTNTIKPMSEQGLKAHQMNLSLAQLLPLLKDLPPGGGALGALLSSNPDLGWLTTAAGITDPKQTDAVRLVNGLVANISTQMKPTGLGALREYEWDAFKSQLPNMLSTTDGQQKAVAILMHMNDRIQQEAAWMNNYYNRKVPDEYAKTPGAMRTAHNLDVPDGSKYLSPQQMMDEKLGPVIPQYTGPPSASGQAQWEQSLPPGQPYYKTVARRDPKNPNQSMRDSSGNVVTTKTYEVRPWQ